MTSSPHQYMLSSAARAMRVGAHDHLTVWLNARSIEESGPRSSIAWRIWGKMDVAGREGSP